MEISSINANQATYLLVEAVKNDDLNEVQRLLDAGAKPDGYYMNPRDKQNTTPLHQACRHGSTDDRFEILIRLLDGGAAPDCQDGLGRTALSYAKTPRKARLLLQRGASVTIQDRYGRTPLHQVVWVTDVLEAILESSSLDLNFKDFLGRTLLHITRRPKSAQLLLRYSADPNELSQPHEKKFPTDIGTALHIALANRNVELSKTLMGLEPKDGTRTAKLSQIVKFFPKGIAGVIMDFAQIGYADPTIVDGLGRTALNVAREILEEVRDDPGSWIRGEYVKLVNLLASRTVMD